MKQLLERKHGTRIMVFALFLTMLAWLVPVNVGVVKAASGDTKIPVDGGYLLFDKETGAITGYEGDIKNVTIPAEFEDCEITSIRSYAFDDCSSLSSVDIPDGVTTIGGYAFNYCSSLSSVSIPNSVTTIGGYAFNYCSSLSSVSIPNGVTTIGESAFNHCSSLSSVSIPNSVTTIWLSAFSHCSSLTSIAVDEGNQDYSSQDGVLFDKAKEELIQYPIGNKRASYEIPDSVTTIWSYAFNGCSSLTSVKIPGSITTIGYDAFYGCSSLTSVSIPNSVTTIGTRAFSSCSGVASVSIPASVTSIGADAFGASSDRSGVASIDVSEDNENYSSQDGVLFDKAKEELIQYPIGNKRTSYEVPNSVTTIGKSAFRFCDSLSSVRIPNSVTTIGIQAFRGCSGLSSVNIPESVTTVGGQAFRDCSGLSSVSVPNSITTIGSLAFCGCNSLMSIDVSEDNENYSSQDGVLFDKAKKELIQYPIGNKRASYEIPNSVTTIKVDAFYNCSSLSSVSIPNSVTTIRGEAFRDCSSLTRVNIPNGITTIETLVFWGCSSLSSVDIPDSVTTIGDSAFSDCSSLTSVSIPNSVTTIWSYAFYDCSSLTSVTIPDSVTAIGDSAFGYQWDGGGGLIKIPNFKIYGYSNDSRAAKYAKDNGFDYAIVGGEDADPDDNKGDNDQNNVPAVPDKPVSSGKIQVGVPVKYGQTEARTMLNDINEFRTGSDAWAWNETDTQQVQYTNLKTLTYDYGLEKVAMRRAAEIALAYAHERPNGESCFSAYTEQGLSINSRGENIAAGQMTAADVFTDWQETKDPYSGQGHRRNMLSEKFTAVGIGHVVYNGTHFWVQEFGGSTSGIDSTTADNSAKTVPVEVLQSKITNTSVVASQKAIQVLCGEKVKLPQLNIDISLEDTWPSGLVPVEVPYTWELESNSYASISNGMLVAREKTGETKLTAKVELDRMRTVTVPVRVLALSPTSPSTTETVKKNKAVQKNTAKPKQSILTKVTSRKKGTLTLTWKKDTKVTGYQSVVAADKKFKKNKKTAAIKKNKTVTKTFTKLKRKKVYYAKVRAYKQVGKTKVYGAYSKVKKAKVK